MTSSRPNQSSWAFSWVGLFWAAIAVLLLFAGGGGWSIVIAMVLAGYSVYLFRGGRFAYIIW